MVKSYKGREVDISSIIEANSKMRVAGNMRVNVRGDLIGKGGKILKTREQLVNEYYKSNPNAVKESEQGFNKGFSRFRDKVMSNELSKEEKEKDPFKQTKKDNPNLSTSSKDAVKFTDIAKTEDNSQKSSEDEFTDFEIKDDDFELDSDQETSYDNNTKSKRGRKPKTE